jgi:hypothetical protein
MLQGNQDLILDFRNSGKKQSSNMVNSYLYTTGGVVERIAQGELSTDLQHKAQASKAIAEFDKVFSGSR